MAPETKPTQEQFTPYIACIENALFFFLYFYGITMAAVANLGCWSLHAAYSYCQCIAIGTFDISSPLSLFLMYQQIAEYQ